MARPCKLTDMHELASALLNAKNNEKAAMVLLRLWLAFGKLESVLGVSRIGRHRFEFHVSGGRIDLLLFHTDGGVSIVEAKADNALLTVASGIGQLCMYATLLPATLGAMNPAYINRILVAPTDPDKCADLAHACEIAGVRFCPLPQFKIIKEQADALRKKYGAEISADTRAVG
jgi:hypothetical protein